MQTNSDRLPWYRQPLVWMIIVIPMSAVVGGMITIWLAIESSDGLVVDDYYWQGKQINRRMERERTAEVQGIKGQVQFNAETGKFRMLMGRTSDVQDWPETLDVAFHHATREGFDKVVSCRHQGGGIYDGDWQGLHQGKWYVETGTGEWRIGGVIRMPGAHGLTMTADFLGY